MIGLPALLLCLCTFQMTWGDNRDDKSKAARDFAARSSRLEYDLYNLSENDFQSYVLRYLSKDLLYDAQQQWIQMKKEQKVIHQQGKSFENRVQDLVDLWMSQALHPELLIKSIRRFLLETQLQESERRRNAGENSIFGNIDKINKFCEDLNNGLLEGLKPLEEGIVNFKSAEKPDTPIFYDIVTRAETTVIQFLQITLEVYKKQDSFFCILEEDIKIKVKNFYYDLRNNAFLTQPFDPYRILFSLQEKRIAEPALDQLLNRIQQKRINVGKKTNSVSDDSDDSDDSEEEDSLAGIINELKELIKNMFEPLLKEYPQGFLFKMSTRECLDFYEKIIKPQVDTIACEITAGTEKETPEVPSGRDETLREDLYRSILLVFNALCQNGDKRYQVPVVTGTGAEATPDENKPLGTFATGFLYTMRNIVEKFLFNVKHIRSNYDKHIASKVKQQEKGFYFPVPQAYEMQLISKTLPKLERNFNTMLRFYQGYMKFLRTEEKADDQEKYFLKTLTSIMKTFLKESRLELVGFVRNQLFQEWPLASQVDNTKVYSATEQKTLLTTARQHIQQFEEDLKAVTTEVAKVLKDYREFQEKSRKSDFDYGTLQVTKFQQNKPVSQDFLEMIGQAIHYVDRMCRITLYNRPVSEGKLVLWSMSYYESLLILYSDNVGILADYLRLRVDSLNANKKFADLEAFNKEGLGKLRSVIERLLLGENKKMWENIFGSDDDKNAPLQVARNYVTCRKLAPYTIQKYLTNKIRMSLNARQAQARRAT